ncbi:MAG: PDZ domain-containing protein, partial [Planctomycetes bacterium]|nr:PDZ domain-containing protein [Planctomycetota bacterium]
SIVHIRVQGGKIPERRREQILNQYKQSNPWYDFDVLSALEQQLMYADMGPGTGSGLVIDEGLILTNHHVVEGRTEIKISLPTGQNVDGALIATDHVTDLALLKIPPAAGLLPARLGNSDQLKVGDWVIVVGAPFGLTHTATHGMVSALAREAVEGMPAIYQSYIQTDAPIHPGNSGGPMLDLEGKIVGIVTAQAPLSDAVSAGIGFALPSNKAREVIEKLRKGEIEHAWLGIVAVDLTDMDAEVYRVRAERGVLATAIYRGTTAESAGLQVDDVIVSIQSNPIRNLAQLQNRLADLAPGQVVRLGTIRDGKRRDLSVKLESAPDEKTRNSLRTIDDRTIPQLPYRLRTLRSGMHQRRLYHRSAFGRVTEQREYDVRGVRIMLPTPEGATTRAGGSFGFGDTIVKCEDKEVRSVADLLEVLRTRKPGDKVTVELYERGSTTTKTELVITGAETRPAQ